ncbi:MAG TPA: YhjD/YihY/BrkB family envelope integrity protein [Candidatus Saccharimonadales bacterium]|nr:YhjD/YihY/BrkB family envelope integrity protein [Candidatus Saccharimonadales bacterium]
MAKTTQTPQGNVIQRSAIRLDHYQQRHHLPAFLYALIKKYGDDDAGHQAALITYYGFLSLFPMLLVGTTAIDIVAQHNGALRTRLITDMNSYFPIVGHQLQSSVHAGGKTGLALVIGLLFALYGARGIADAVRGALDHAWAVPRVKRSGFPKGLIRSLGLLLGAGLGLLLTTGLSSYALAAFGHSWALRTVPIIVNGVLLYLIFMYVFLIGTSSRHKRKDVRLGAITTALGLLLLQAIGGYLITHQLQNLRGLYGQFALVLAILFWIYLQAQVLMYAIELNVVHTYQLWPRSLTGKPLTAADETALRMYAEKEARTPQPPEKIQVSFHNDHF